MLSKHAGKCRIGEKAEAVAECAVSLEADKAEVCAAIFKVVPEAAERCGVVVIAGRIVLMHSKAEEDGECVVSLEGMAEAVKGCRVAVKADKAETLSSKVAADEVVTLGSKNKAVT